MSLRTELRRGLKVMERMTNSPTLYFRNRNYACTVSTLRKGNVITVGGIEATVQMTLLVRKDIMVEPVTADTTLVTADSTSFTADPEQPPLAGNKLQVRAHGGQRTYRVVEVREPAPGSHWEFDLAHYNK